MKKVLIVEDDYALGKGVGIALQSENLCVILKHNIQDARLVLREEKIDLMILDINLPDGNGLAFLEEIRRSSPMPVIMLTAQDMETDIVLGLESGADDYITKPFSLAVLRARVNTQLRKAKSGDTFVYETKEYLFAFGRMEFFHHGKIVELTKTEQRLLLILVQNRGQILKRSTLVDRIWTDGADYVDENALSVTVKRLRDKLEDDPANPVHIQTAYGLGYGWMEKQDD